MDGGGDVRAGGKKKRSKPFEIGLGSDDDELIGSMFKLRTSRGSKNKAGLAASEGSGGEGGKKNVAMEEKVAVEEGGGRGAWVQWRREVVVEGDGDYFFNFAKQLGE